MNPRQLEADAIKWWHTMELPGDIVTKGHHRPADFLPMLQLPDLTGKTVLDVGTWDGFFAFEAERRGASRVIAADSHVWEAGFKDGFDFAHRQLNSNVEAVFADPMFLEAELPLDSFPFDVVLCLGVLYHMRHPFKLIENLYDITKGLLILETHIDCEDVNRPMIAFYPDRELGNDPTNWCGPNVLAVLGMLKAVGFETVNVHKYASSRAVFHCFKTESPALVLPNLGQVML